MSADNEAALDIVYGEYLIRQELGDPVSPEEILVRFPHLAEELRLQFNFGRALAGTQQVAAATRVPPVGDALASHDVPASDPGQAVGVTTSSGTRYRILRPHARGGLGEVLYRRRWRTG